MKAIKRIATFIMAIAMMIALVSPATVEAATKVKLNKKKVTLTITDSKKNPSVTLKVKNTAKKAKWSTSNKTVATVKKGKVTAKGAGNATITCKVNGKKLTCKVTVVDKRKISNVTRLPIDFKNIKDGTIIWLGEYELSQGDKISYRVSAETGYSMKIAFVLPNDDPLNRTFYSVHNTRTDDKLEINSDFIVDNLKKSEKFRLFIYASNGDLENVEGSITITKSTSFLDSK